MRGPEKWPEETHKKFKERKAWLVLNRITWLANYGCCFSFDFASKSVKLKSLLPEWENRHADRAVESMESRGGMVRTETEHSVLLTQPLANILPTAASLNGRADDFLVEINPFAGLAKERPIRAFLALVNAAKNNDYPEWAWRTFFHSDERSNDRAKFRALIAERVSRMPNSAIGNLLRPASDWLAKIAKGLAADSPSSFDRVMSKFIDILKSQPDAASSAVVRGSKQPDWTMEAINSPTGKITEALMELAGLRNLAHNEGLPPTWKRHADALLELKEDQRRYALVIFSHQLVWLHYIDSEWAISRIVIPWELNLEDEENAIWSGFLWAARVPNIELYLRIKPALLLLAKNRSISQRGYTESLSGMILAGWGGNPDDGHQLITDDEMREFLIQTDDDFRSRILWQINSWTQPSEDAKNIWPSLLIKFLKNVWPRQKTAKTAQNSARLVEIAFANIEYFEEIVTIILPLLTAIDRGYVSLPYLDSEKKVIQTYPKHTLVLMNSVLSNVVSNWPYGTEEVLSAIINAAPKLKYDMMYVELNRKWNAR